MSQILDEENAIIEAAATEMVALGSAISQDYVEGIENEEDYETAKKIFKLLKAYRKKDDLTTPELEALLACLRDLSDEEVFPSISPLIGQALSVTTARQNLDQTLAIGNDGGAQYIRNILDPVLDQDADTKGARDAAISEAIGDISVTVGTVGVQSVTDAATIELVYTSVVSEIARLITNRTAINLNISGLYRGGRYVLIIKKQNASDLILTVDYNSYPMYLVNGTAVVTTITLSGAANKIFKIEFFSMAQIVGISLLNADVGLTIPPQAYGLHAISDTEVVVGGKGELRKSTNGGLAFSTIYEDLTTPFGTSSYGIKDMSFVGDDGIAVANVRFALGAWHDVFITADGGDSWVQTRVTAFGTIQWLRPNCVFMIDATTWLIGGRNLFSIYTSLYKITAGVVSGPSVPYEVYDICMGSSYIFLCGASRQIRYSTDNGATWSSIATTAVASSHIWRAIAFFDNSIGFVGGDSGLLYKTTNGGTVWSQLTGLDASIGKIYDIGVHDSTGVIVCGEFGVAYSADSGSTWDLNTDVPNFVKISVVDAANIFLLTGDGALYLYNADTTGQLVFVAEPS